MKSQLEYFDILVNTQKQVIGNIVTAQKDLHAQIIDATGKASASIAVLPGVSELPVAKAALSQFNAWFSTAANNVEAFKFQESLISNYEKQLANSRAVLKSFVDFSAKAKATA